MLKDKRKLFNTKLPYKINIVSNYNLANVLPIYDKVKLKKKKKNQLL